MHLKLAGVAGKHHIGLALVEILDQINNAPPIPLAQSQTVCVTARLRQSGDPALLTLPDPWTFITLASNAG